MNNLNLDDLIGAKIRVQMDIGMVNKLVEDFILDYKYNDSLKLINLILAKGNDLTIWYINGTFYYPYKFEIISDKFYLSNIDKEYDIRKIKVKDW